jgi:hypothetical protein
MIDIENSKSLGPTVKYENSDCTLRFHVECARVVKCHLELVNNSSGEVIVFLTQK